MRLPGSIWTFLRHFFPYSHRAEHRTARLGGARRKSSRDGRLDPLDVSRAALKLAGAHHLFALSAQRQAGTVRFLRQQANGGQRKMSALRQRLKRPETYLVLLLIVGGLALADSFRAPDQQVTALAYVWSVHLYQGHLSRQLAGRVRCRFQPTCSHYSEEAVRRFGIRKGLRRTANRLWRCRNDVPLETRDPLPDFAVASADSPH